LLHAVLNVPKHRVVVWKAEVLEEINPDYSRTIREQSGMHDK
jgi:hypothetical protein